MDIRHIITGLGRRNYLNFLSDKTYIDLVYFFAFGHRVNWNNPRTFNEKLQWLKLYDRNPEYIMMVDKYKVREYIKRKLGDEYLIPLLGVWDEPEEIDFNKLPNQFVLKWNHDSGSVIICKNKERFDKKNAIKRLNSGKFTNGYWYGREWPYKDVPRKIIAEKYMVDESGYELKDYKIFCFNGKPKALYVAKDRQSQDKEMKWNFYDMDWNLLPFWNGHSNSYEEIKAPKSLIEMKRLAEKLSDNIPHVRVDFYDINGRVYFGELTFYHNSGFSEFHPEEWDEQFGKWINLPNEPKGGTFI